MSEANGTVEKGKDMENLSFRSEAEESLFLLIHYNRHESS